MARPGAALSPSGFLGGAEAGKTEVGRLHNKLVERHGKDRADRIALKNRNLFIFPNLVINDIMALTVRTYFPIAPDYMAINAWALAPNDESAWARKYRLNNFLEFLGPGGFATPDDVEALGALPARISKIQRKRYGTTSQRAWARTSRCYDDELQMRAFWTQWNKQMFQHRCPASETSQREGG